MLEAITKSIISHYHTDTKSDILKIIELTRELSLCRSLDAIHVASGYYLIQSYPELKLDFYSLDKRVNEVARKIGIKPHFE